LLAEKTGAVVQAFHGEKELFMSRHTDYIDADTINEKCDVMSISDFMVRPPTPVTRHTPWCSRVARTFLAWTSLYLSIVSP